MWENEPSCALRCKLRKLCVSVVKLLFPVAVLVAFNPSHSRFQFPSQVDVYMILSVLSILLAF